MFIDTEEMENDTLEEIYGLCRSGFLINFATFFFNLQTPLFQRQIETSPGATKGGDQLEQRGYFPINCRRNAFQVKNLIEIIINQLDGLQAGRCSSIFFKTFLFSCTPFSNSKVS